MTSQNEPLKQPDRIEGEEYQIMVRIAKYVEKHEPINEYFDPVRAKEAFDREGHNWEPRDRYNFRRHYTEAVTRQQEAYSETFNIIEMFLTENPDIDLNILDRAYVEMARLYGFNYDLNQTYIRFRSYYHESREFMKSLETKFPDKKLLIEYLTGIKIEDSQQYSIVRGPFAFEIRLPQELLNRFDTKKIKLSLYERIVEKIAPLTNLGGINNEIEDPNTETKANYIIYPINQPLVDFFRGFDDFMRKSSINKFLSELNLRSQKSGYSLEDFRIHENQHALYNLIITAERTYSNRDIISEIEGILKESDPDKVSDIDFSNFCYFLVKNVFYENAAHEMLARIKDGNFISSIRVINNPEVYNYENPYLVGVDMLDNLFIDETLKKFIEHPDQQKKDKYSKIYKSYTDQSRIYIYNLTISIAQFLQRYPNKNRELTNILMFKTLDKWEEEVKNYYVYLLKK